MKTIFLCRLAAALSLVATRECTAAERVETNYPPPALCLEEALAIAKAFVQEHHLTAESETYVDSIKLERRPTDNEERFWLVTWLPNRYATDLSIKGGQLYVRVFLNKTVKVFHGE